MSGAQRASGSLGTECAAEIGKSPSVTGPDSQVKHWLAPKSRH